MYMKLNPWDVRDFFVKAPIFIDFDNTLKEHFTKLPIKLKQAYLWFLMRMYVYKRRKYSGA